VAAPAKTKKCTTCAAAIPVDATYCTKCQNYQNWRKHLQLGVYTLPMLVALAAIISSSVPAISQWLSGNNSRLITSALRPVSRAVDLTVANLGDRPGVIDEVTFQLARLDDPESPLSRWVRPHTIQFTTMESPIVPPGDVRKVRFALAPGQEESIVTATIRQGYGSYLNEASCSFVFSATEFSGAALKFEREVSCLQTWLALFPDAAAELRLGLNEALSRWVLPSETPQPLPAPGGANND
jgi:ribosomal protein L40E